MSRSCWSSRFSASSTSAFEDIVASDGVAAAERTPLGSTIMITRPSPRMVDPEKCSMLRSAPGSGFTTISSVRSTESTSMPNLNPRARMTMTKPSVLFGRGARLTILVDGRGELQDRAQIDDRQQAVARAQHRRVLDELDRVRPARLHLEKLVHGGLRDGEVLAVDADDEGTQDGEGERDLQREHRALAHDRAHVDGAADALHVRLHHVHAHSAAGDRGDFRRCRKARLEDERENLLVRHSIGIFLRGDAAFDRLLLDPVDVEAAPVVARSRPGSGRLRGRRSA